MNPEDIAALIEAGMDNATVSVSGDGSKFEAQIISTAFDGLNTVKRHKLVYPLVNEHIKSGAIHALTLRTLTPDEA